MWQIAGESREIQDITQADLVNRQPGAPQQAIHALTNESLNPPGWCVELSRIQNDQPLSSSDHWGKREAQRSAVEYLHSVMPGETSGEGARYMHPCPIVTQQHVADAQDQSLVHVQPPAGPMSGEGKRILPPLPRPRSTYLYGGFPVRSGME